MKESMWGYLIISLGIVIVAVILLVQRFTSSGQQDYFLSREIMKASMEDAVDYGSYRQSCKVVMSKEKFVAVFTRRFAESVPADRTYQLDFYDIHEYPPKATVKISTKTGETVIKDDMIDLDINTYLTGILETKEQCAIDGVSNGWVRIDNLDNSKTNMYKQQWMYHENGVKVVGEKSLKPGEGSNKYFHYYFNSDGIMQVGWVKWNDGTYHLYSPIDKDGGGELDGRRVQSKSGTKLGLYINGNESKRFYVDAEGKCYNKDKKVCTSSDVSEKVTNIELDDWTNYGS